MKYIIWVLAFIFFLLASLLAQKGMLPYFNILLETTIGELLLNPFTFVVIILFAMNWWVLLFEMRKHTPKAHIRFSVLLFGVTLMSLWIIMYGAILFGNFKNLFVCVTAVSYFFGTLHLLTAITKMIRMTEKVPDGDLRVE